MYALQEVQIYRQDVSEDAWNMQAAQAQESTDAQMCNEQQSASDPHPATCLAATYDAGTVQQDQQQLSNDQGSLAMWEQRAGE